MPLHLAKLKYLSICLLVALVAVFLTVLPATIAQATTVETTPSQAVPTQVAPTQATPTQAVPSEAAPTEAALTQAVPTESVDADKPFNAPLCSGTTSKNPAGAEGAVKDLTMVFGKRLEDYNAGRTVILYSSNGTNGGTPNCAVKRVEGVGAVSEWMYCTDQAGAHCSSTNADGELIFSDKTVGSMADLAQNPRLTAEQEQLIAFLLHFDRPVTAFPGASAPTALTASDATSESRLVRQYLIWCVSDRASFNKPHNKQTGAWCDANMGEATQATILKGMNETPLLKLSPATTEATPGNTAKVKLTTNLFNRPLQIAPLNATVELCEGEGKLSNGVLTVTNASAAAETTVTLCLAYTNSTEVSLSVRGETIEIGGLKWSQSPGADRPCQVYIHRTAASTKAATASARVLFAEPKVPTGGFSLKKSVTGTGAAAVPATTEFAIEYTVDGGPVQTVALTSTDAATLVEGLPIGATVEVEEAAIPAVNGITWAAPSIAVDGEVAGTPATFTIAEGSMVEVVVANSATTVATPLASTTPATPTAVATTPDVEPTAAPTTEAPEALAATGWSSQVALVSVALLLLGAIALLTVQRRRQRGIHS